MNNVFARTKTETPKPKIFEQRSAWGEKSSKQDKSPNFELSRTDPDDDEEEAEDDAVALFDFQTLDDDSKKVEEKNVERFSETVSKRLTAAEWLRRLEGKDRPGAIFYGDAITDRLTLHRHDNLLTDNSLAVLKI